MLRQARVLTFGSFITGFPRETTETVNGAAMAAASVLAWLRRCAWTI